MERAYQRPAIEDLGTLADITLGGTRDIPDVNGLGIGASIGPPPRGPQLPGLGL